MGESITVGPRKVLRFVLARVALPLLLITSSVRAAARPSDDWTIRLAERLKLLEASHAGSIGLYVKDLASGREFSHRADEAWYVASGVKVPVALEVLAQRDAGKLSFDLRVEVRTADLVDGAGSTNGREGESVSVRFLVEQMLIHSDNTASDLLIGLVGLDRINLLVNQLVPGASFRMTTLGDVRRHVYAGFHPRAFELRGPDLLLLKSTRGEKRKMAALASLLHLPASELRPGSLEAAYTTFYVKRLNTMTLRSYGLLLQAGINGGTLRGSSKKYLLDVLTRVRTGERRIKAGLPPSVRFAHKTGTQHARTCDFGIVSGPGRAVENGLIVAACTRGIRSLQRSEDVLRRLGVAISASGVLSDAT